MVSGPERAYGRVFSLPTDPGKIKSTPKGGLSQDRWPFTAGLHPAHFCNPYCPTIAQLWVSTQHILVLERAVLFHFTSVLDILKKNIFNLLLNSSKACLCGVIEKYENIQWQKLGMWTQNCLISNELCEAALHMNEFHSKVWLSHSKLKFKSSINAIDWCKPSPHNLPKAAVLLD